MTTGLPRRQGGYVLVLVMVSLAVLAFVATGFSLRIDSLRKSTGSLRDLAAAQQHMSGALAAALYVLAGQSRQAMGYGDVETQALADDRRYRLPTGAALSIQDLRGLPSLNIVNRPMLRTILGDQGVAVQDIDRYLDVLLDYTDLDSLKRLNGAEAADYQALSLGPPRNDYMRSVSELAALPGWRDDPIALERLSSLLSARRSGWNNPNTAPAEVVRAMFAGAAPSQLARFLALRSVIRPNNPVTLLRDFGLDASREDFLLNVGPEVRVTVWAPGHPQALQYNVLLVPAGPIGPWLISEQRAIPRPELPNDASDIEPFPLAMASPQRSQDMGTGRP